MIRTDTHHHHVAAFASSRAGARSRVMELDVSITFAGFDPFGTLAEATDSDYGRQVAAVREWLDLYVDGEDLRGAFDFEPSAQAIALYLGTVVPQLACDVVALAVACGDAMYGIDLT